MDLKLLINVFQLVHLSSDYGNADRMCNDDAVYKEVNNYNGMMFNSSSTFMDSLCVTYSSLEIELHCVVLDLLILVHVPHKTFDVPTQVL